MKKDLPEGVEFPVCMKMFSHIGEVEKIAKECGFVGVEIDTSDGKLTREVSEAELKMLEEEKKESNGGRTKIHRDDDSEEFKHLNNFDMNALCARLVVVGRKP